jgi:hypothetical protein
MSKLVFRLIVLGLGTLVVSCTDPVRDRQIERLGGEDPRVPQGPEHRPGQPCVLCHSDGGPASDHKFAIAGTIFETSSPDSKGAEGVQVFFVDASSAMRVYTTNAAGNFLIPESEWSDLTFPFRVGLLKEGVNKNMPIPMSSVVNREGSCNFCHRPNPGSPYAIPGDDPRSSIGQIYLTNAGGTP